MHNFVTKNRPSNSLGILDIELEAAYGTDLFDPNSILLHVLQGKLNEVPPVPGRVSDLSGGPAVGYRTNEVELSLTVPELHRLVRHELTPLEFFSLAERYGIFHEIHDDFYDTATGIALQSV